MLSRLSAFPRHAPRQPAGDAVAAGQGEVPGGDAEPDRGGDGAGDGVVQAGQEVAMLVGHGDAVLAGQFEPGAVELVDEFGAVTGLECLVDLRAQPGGAIEAGP